MITPLWPDMGTLFLHMRKSDPPNTLFFLNKAGERQKTNLPGGEA